jgi:FkbM family methyltransferase
MKIYNIPFFRKIILPVIKFFSFDFNMAHPWNTNVTIRLNSFMHKGYWFHGKNREKNTMSLFGEIINIGDTVVEVGGHIGFITTYFARLVGESGKVFVFEPGENNMPYIKKNISFKNAGALSEKINLIEKAVSTDDGVATFYEDSLTGQNNSLLKNFDGLRKNQENSFVQTDVAIREVPTTSIDKFFSLKGGGVDFIKIDIEGHEWGAIQGGSQLISQYLPKMMIEIQASRVELYEFLKNIGYVLFNDSLQLKKAPADLNGNIFCLHREKHSSLIHDLGILEIDS